MFRSLSDRLLALTAVAVAVTVTACGGASAAPPANTALTVNGSSIATARYDHLVSAELDSLSTKGIPVDTSTAEGRQKSHDIQVGSLQELVSETVLTSMAGKRHVTVSDDEVNGAIAKVEQTVGGPAKLQQRLAQSGESQDDFHRLVKLGRLRVKLRNADPGFESSFNKEVKAASVQAFVGPCAQDHNYPHCIGK